MSNIRPKSHRGQPAPQTWRSILPIHEAAEILPRLSDTALNELGENIKKRGLQEPIAIQTGVDGVERLLDEISRLDAMERTGSPIVVNGEINLDVVETRAIAGNVDPYEYVLSANVHRRHLTIEQKRDTIAKLLKAKPGQSNRTIAKQVKADHKTVGKVRDKLESTGDVPQLKTTTGADGKDRKRPARKSKPVKGDREPLQSGDLISEPVAIADSALAEPDDDPVDFELFALDLNEQFKLIWEWCHDDSYWPPLDDARRKRRGEAINQFRGAWSELVELAKPVREHGRPRQVVEA